MTTQKVEKQKKFLSSLHKFIFISCIFFSSFASGQSDEKSSRKLKKIGLLFNSAKQNNILFSDNDYNYKTNVFKVQFFYDLYKGKKWDINLIVQPQAQIVKHQLLNEQFITPDEINFQEIRSRLTQKRTISLLAFELGFQLRKEIFHQIYFETTLGLGVAYIDKETERLAQGFTFIENLSVGFSKEWETTEVYLGTNLGHVSNLNIQLPNSGYNVLGFEIGYRFLIK